jgi:hypothetical protein
MRFLKCVFIFLYNQDYRMAPLWMTVLNANMFANKSGVFMIYSQFQQQWSCCTVPLQLIKRGWNCVVQQEPSLWIGLYYHRKPEPRCKKSYCMCQIVAYLHNFWRTPGCLVWHIIWISGSSYSEKKLLFQV